MYDEFFNKAQELSKQDIPFATALIVFADKPTSGKLGDKAIITADGTLFGWIGGSCAQPTVIKEALKALSDGQSRLIRLSPNPKDLTPREGLIDFPMTCFSGGTLEIYIEPQYPKPRLIVVGDLAIAQALSSIAKVMSYEVLMLDPEKDADAIGKQVRPDTYVVVATHGNFDELALESALKARPDYIGLVSSKKRFQSILDYLKKAGFTDEALDVLKAPAGLDIQAVRADEIALSIMAEIVQKRRNRQAYDLSAFTHKTVPVEIAIDPVCGMEVKIAKAKATHEYHGTTYYFCCNGCKQSFIDNPEAYLQKA
jgi:xanthine dehydrogenase accessory factor